ncbi:MAG: hypothetical protein LBS39_04040 [Campylobacteraceae bacterium]|jgi:uncharacterized protein (UPF0128 family)|nr:hypothetical protein [Campylobacteraceae bacterium]
MNKINPLILISVLILVLLVEVYSVSHLKSEIQKSDKALFELDNNAKRILFLKKIWNKTNLEDKLKSIFGEGALSDKGKVFEVKAVSLTHEQVNDMTKKVLGTGFEIEKFEIVTDSEDRTSLVLEIAK